MQGFKDDSGYYNVAIVEKRTFLIKKHEYYTRGEIIPGYIFYARMRDKISFDFLNIYLKLK